MGKKSKETQVAFLEARRRIAEAKREKAEMVDLTQLGLKDLPDDLFECTDLQRLYLGANCLSELPERIGDLKNLTALSVYNNQLTSLPARIGDLKSLTGLDVSNNQFTSLPEWIGGLKDLTKLAVGGNQLTSLPEWIGELESLTKLYVWGNSLTFLPERIGNLKNLAELSVSENRLPSLPQWIGGLKNLKFLYARGNQLTSLPRSMRKLTRLRQLYLQDNPKLGIPPEILGPTPAETIGETKDRKDPASPVSILDYYFREKRPLNEAKLILVGFGAVGKTSLVNRLVYNTFDKDEKKTDGIRITQWPVDLPAGEKVRLHVWDFGGQEIMHSTHQFFLSQRSLYLLVLNGRQGHEDGDAEYWLNLIQSFGGDSPVIVALNKIREQPFDLNRLGLQQKFPGMIRAFVETECEGRSHGKDTIGLEELRRAILDETNCLAGLRDGFPREWFAIKDRLAGMPENYITFEKYREICAGYGEIAAADQEKLAFFLHHLGIALNYKDDPRLRDMHVLNPHWVTNGIYTILNAEKLS